MAQLMNNNLHSYKNEIEQAKAQVNETRRAYNKAKNKLKQLEKSANPVSVRASALISVLPKTLKPVEQLTVFNTKETIAYVLFGKKISSKIFYISKSKPFAIYHFIGRICFVLSMMSSINLLPPVYCWLCIILWVPPIFTFLLANNALFKRLLFCFEIWYLFVYIMSLFICCCLLMTSYQLICLSLNCAGMLLALLGDTLPSRDKSVKYAFVTSVMVAIFNVCAFYFNWFEIIDQRYRIGRLEISLVSTAMNCLTTILIFSIRNLYGIWKNPNHLIVIRSLMVKSNMTNESISSREDSK